MFAFPFQIGDPNGNKPIIWVDAGIHAREWIAPATALHLINVVSRFFAFHASELKNSFK